LIVDAPLALVEGRFGLCELLATKFQEIVDPHQRRQSMGGTDIEKNHKEIIDSR
jgi:hypothetical protein